MLRTTLALALALVFAGAAHAQQPACPGSPRQFCKMLCPTLSCPAGQCAMRSGTCCNLQCQPMAGAGAGAQGAAQGLPKGAPCTTSRTRANRGRPQKCAAGLTCKITDPGDMRVDRPNSGLCVGAAAGGQGSAGAIPAGCVLWHDGCNNCQIVNGRKAGCTEMACFRNDGARCLRFGGDALAAAPAPAPTRCAAGQMLSEEGSCMACPAGTYSPTGRGRSCTPCKPGTYNPFAGAASCQRCPRGQSAPSVGMTSCQVSIATGGGLIGMLPQAEEGMRCAEGFCESGNCPKCTDGLKCVVPPGLMCAGTCYGTCQSDGH